MQKTFCRVVSGRYEGREGFIFGAIPGNDLKCVLFYPKEGIHPYRVAMRPSELEACEWQR